MTIKTLHHVTVDDLAAAIAFIFDPGSEREGEAAVEGNWVDRINGLDSVRVDIVMMRTPGGRRRARSAELVGEVAQREDAYRLDYLRGPGSMIVALPFVSH